MLGTRWENAIGTKGIWRRRGTASKARSSTRKTSLPFGTCPSWCDNYYPRIRQDIGGGWLGWKSGANTRLRWGTGDWNGALVIPFVPSDLDWSNKIHFRFDGQKYDEINLSFEFGQISSRSWLEGQHIFHSSVEYRPSKHDLGKSKQERGKYL